MKLFPIADIMGRLKVKPRLMVSGLHGSSSTLFVHELAQHKPLVVIPEEMNIERYYRELRSIGDDVSLVNEENRFFLPSRIIVVERHMLSSTVIPLCREVFRLQQDIDMEGLLMRLEESGYTREENVEEENEYAARGGIVDIFEANGLPVRIELFGDKIFSIRRFDTQTQRSIDQMDDVVLKLAAPGRRPGSLAVLLPDQYILFTEVDTDFGRPLISLSNRGEIDFGLTAPRIY
jgi:transcription-repair coupling factor (superfamily II helicase)